MGGIAGGLGGTGVGAQQPAPSADPNAQAFMNNANATGKGGWGAGGGNGMVGQPPQGWDPSMTEKGPMQPMAADEMYQRYQRMRGDTPEDMGGIMQGRPPPPWMNRGGMGGWGGWRAPPPPEQPTAPMNYQAIDQTQSNEMMKQQEEMQKQRAAGPLQVGFRNGGWVRIR